MKIAVFLYLIFFNLTPTLKANPEVSCVTELGDTWLTRISDWKRLGKPMTDGQCIGAVSGSKSGVACTFTIYPDRFGWTPTIINKARGLGLLGAVDLSGCNRLIGHADKLIVCSFNGPGRGYLPTRTYGVSPEPARQLHRIGEPIFDLFDCLEVADQSVVHWNENGLTHQTCKLTGGAWEPACASNTDVDLHGVRGTLDECIEQIQTLNSSCTIPLNDELRLLREVVVGY